MENRFAYHRVREHFIGDFILPMNQLKVIYPEIAKDYISKYNGREHILKTEVHTGFSWLDYAFLGLHHPRLIFNTLRELGFDIKIGSHKYFEIPIEKIDPSPNKTLVWKFTQDCPIESIDWSDCISLKDAHHEINLEILTDKTLEHFQESFQKEKNPLLWLFLPHLMTREPINIRDCNIISV